MSNKVSQNFQKEKKKENIEIKGLEVYEKKIEAKGAKIIEVNKDYKRNTFISCFPVGYREISVKIFFDLTLVPPVKIPIFTFLLPRLIARASQPDGNMTSFTLHFSRMT